MFCSRALQARHVRLSSNWLLFRSDRQIFDASIACHCTAARFLALSYGNAELFKFFLSAAVQLLAPLVHDIGRESKFWYSQKEWS